MATYNLTTTTARQDAALVFAANQAGAATVDAYVQAQFVRIVQRALNARDQDETSRLDAAYLAASAATQNQVKGLLGLP
jgi:hypothetical protein